MSWSEVQKEYGIGSSSHQNGENNGDGSRINVGKRSFFGKLLNAGNFYRSGVMFDSNANGEEDEGGMEMLFLIDSEGYIDLDQPFGYIENNSLAKIAGLRIISMLRTPANMASFVRNNAGFKNARLKRFLGRWYREKALVPFLLLLFVQNRAVYRTYRNSVQKIDTCDVISPGYLRFFSLAPFDSRELRILY